MEKHTPDNLVVSAPLEELGKYVPVRALQELVNEASGEQEAPKHATKEVLLDEVRKLVESRGLAVDQINNVIQDYKFAGRVSISWGIPFKWITLSKK